MACHIHQLVVKYEMHSKRRNVSRSYFCRNSVLSLNHYLLYQNYDSLSTNLGYDALG
jgi:hypothetical protein